MHANEALRTTNSGKLLLLAHPDAALLVAGIPAHDAILSELVLRQNVRGGPPHPHPIATPSPPIATPSPPHRHPITTHRHPIATHRHPSPPRPEPTVAAAIAPFGPGQTRSTHQHAHPYHRPTIAPTLQRRPCFFSRTNTRSRPRSAPPVPAVARPAARWLRLSS